jgi:hypothetical protein
MLRKSFITIAAMAVGGSSAWGQTNVINEGVGRPGDAACGSANGNCNLIQLQKFNNVSASGSLPAGTNALGSVVISGGATLGATQYRLVGGTTASNNANGVKLSSGVIYDLTVIQPTAVAGQLKMYDAATTTPTCSSTTNLVVSYPIQANTITPGLHLTFPVGKQFLNGISFCATGGTSDVDNSNWTTGISISMDYK